MQQQKFFNEVKNLLAQSEQMFQKWQYYSELDKRESIAMLMYFAHKNFQYYLANLASTAQDRKNRDFVLENLRDETTGNHPRLAREFCSAIGVDIEKTSDEFKKIIWGIDSQIEDHFDAEFISGFMYMAEAYSFGVMNAMMSYAKSKGLQKSPYIEAHSGPMEKKHIRMLAKGLVWEVKTSTHDFTRAFEGVKAWENMICYIFQVKQ